MATLENNITGEGGSSEWGEDPCIACGLNSSIAGDVVCEECSTSPEYGSAELTITIDAADDSFEAELSKLESTLLGLTAELDTLGEIDSSSNTEVSDAPSTSVQDAPKTPIAQTSKNFFNSLESSCDRSLSLVTDRIASSTPVASIAPRKFLRPENVADDLSDDSMFAEDRTLLTDQDEALESDDDTLVPSSQGKESSSSQGDENLTKDKEIKNEDSKYRSIRKCLNGLDERNCKQFVLVDEVGQTSSSDTQGDESNEMYSSNHDKTAELTCSSTKPKNVVTNLVKSEEESGSETGGSYIILDQVSDFSDVDSVPTSQEGDAKTAAELGTSSPKVGQNLCKFNGTPVSSRFSGELKGREVSCTPGGNVWIGIRNDAQDINIDKQREIAVASGGELNIKVFPEGKECQLAASVDGITEIKKEEEREVVNETKVKGNSGPVDLKEELATPRKVSGSKEDEKPKPRGNEYFVSKNPDENQDNNDPEWELLRKLESDEERYRAIRERWRNLIIPDPNQDLTHLAYRKKYFPGQKIPTNKTHSPNQGYKRKNTYENTPAAKRQRTLSVELVFDKQLEKLEQDMSLVKHEVEVDHQRRLVKLCAQQDHDRTLLEFASRGDPISLRNLYNSQLAAVQILRQQYHNSLQNLMSNYNRRKDVLKNASNEVLTFHKFYNGLDAGNNTLLLSEKEINELCELEDMYLQYDALYQ